MLSRNWINNCFQIIIFKELICKASVLFLYTEVKFVAEGVVF